MTEMKRFCDTSENIFCRLPYLGGVLALFLLSLFLWTLPAFGAGWTPTASMALDRQHATVTPLDDGRVLVVGGVRTETTANDTFLTSAVIYDPYSGTFTPAGSLGTGRALHTATKLQDGRVLVVGGWDGTQALSSAEIWDPAHNHFTTVLSLNAARGQHTATLLQDGTVLITGGWNNGPLSTAELFDPDSNTFSYTAYNATQTVMISPRNTHTATLLQDGTVLIAGGWGDPNSATVATAEIYDPANQTFSSTGSMTAARGDNTATLLQDGKVLVAGGYSGNPNNGGATLSSAELYDPGQGTFSPAVGSMNAARQWHSAILLPTGKVLIAGGNNAAAGFHWSFSDQNSFLKSAELYDPANVTFTPIDDMNDRRNGFGMVPLHQGGELFTAGGGTATAELYGAPQRLNWFEVAVGDGNLFVDFDVLPGFRSLLTGAKVNTPGRGEYVFDLVNDEFTSWDSECQYTLYWVKDFGTVGSSDYGTYTLTLDFADGTQKVYTHALQEVAVTAVTDVGVTINSDGSAHVTWQGGAPGQHYQVRVREAGSGKELCRVNVGFDVHDATLTAEELRCLHPGTTYRWLVRAYDDEWPFYNTWETTEISQEYSPANLVLTTSFLVYDWNGNLALGFDVRPGSRDDLSGVTVSGPNGFSYDFDLTQDWFDLSTDTRLGFNGWWKEFTPGELGGTIPIGGYTFTLSFSDGHPSESSTETLDYVSVTPIDPSTMSASILPDGAMTFSWTLPVTGQQYEVRIRSIDGFKEYYGSDQLQDTSSVTASAWDLRALEQGSTYQWFVRAYDAGNNTMKQSEGTFTYDPFGIGLNFTDTDVDGVPDPYDIFPNDPNDQYDADGDGIGNNQEESLGTYPYVADSDGDGLWDGDEVALGTDPLEADTDDDGINDLNDAFPLNPVEQFDADGDGIGDNTDNCSPTNANINILPDFGDIGNGYYNPDQADLDGDHIGNICDKDADGDTYLSVYAQGDDCYDLDAAIFPGDGVSGCEAGGAQGKPPKKDTGSDSDGDTVDDSQDNCPDIPNTPQTDNDQDGLGSACDNCDTFVNPGQNLPKWYKDLDHDGYSDGAFIAQCDDPGVNPGDYLREDDLNLTATIGDCNDGESAVNPEQSEIPGDGLDNDCNAATLDVAQDYTLAIDLFQVNGAPSDYSSWLPLPGDAVTVTFTVTGPNGDVTTTANPVTGEVITAPLTFTLTPDAETATNANPTSYPGAYLNDSSENGNTPVADFGFQPATGLVTMTAQDSGGFITVRASVSLLDALGNPVNLQTDFTFPQDSDHDGLADAWEMKPEVAGNLTTLNSRSADPDKDGLTNGEESRGVKWGRLVQKNDTDSWLYGNNTGLAKYKTDAYVPTENWQGTPEIFRTNPNHRDLFVQFSAFSSDHPFALGTAYHEQGIDVHALSSTVVNSKSINTDYNIDVATITLDPGTYLGLEDPHIYRRNTRDWSFTTLGFSTWGADPLTAYGGTCNVYQATLDDFFTDKTHADAETLKVGGSMRNAGDWVASNGVLDPVDRVEDGNDNGLVNGGEDKDRNGTLTGDRPVPGSDAPWAYDQALSPFDVNNDGLMELPVVGSAGDVNTGYEYDLWQVLKHVATHELGHNVGIKNHTTDPTCVMYEYSNNFLRDNHFCADAAAVISIHNQ